MRGGWRAVVLWECSCPEGFCCGGARGGGGTLGVAGQAAGTAWCGVRHAVKQNRQASSARMQQAVAVPLGARRCQQQLLLVVADIRMRCATGGDSGPPHAAAAVSCVSSSGHACTSAGGVSGGLHAAGGAGGGGIKGRLGSSFGMLCCQECGAHCARVPCVCGVLRCVAVCLSCTDKSSARQFQRLGAEETVRHQLVCARPAVCSPVHADLCGTDFHGCPTFASSFCIFACAGLSCYGVVCHCTCVFQCLRGAGRSGM